MLKLLRSRTPSWKINTAMALLSAALVACGHGSHRDGDNPTPPTNRPSPFTQDSPKLTSCYKGDAWSCAVEAAIVAKTNVKRGKLAPLKQSFETSFVAREHSKDQIRDGMSHAGFPQKRLELLQAEFSGIEFFFSAENVAYMMNSLTDANAVADAFVEMWWKSEGHRNNMLGAHAYLGAGVAREGQRIYATQLFH